jgi:hypothetical protein
MIQSFPRPIHPKVKKQTDDQLAKLGQLNQLVRDVNQLSLNESSPTGIPFDWYPPAGLTTAGPKFTYTDGVELISYHIKGIQSISNSTATGFSEYLCTVSVRVDYGPFTIFPGSLTGMFISGTGNDLITSPLAIGGLIEINGVHVPLTSLAFNLYYYNNNPQPDGSYWYALVAEGTTTHAPGNLTALMSYDFEMLLANFVPAPIILQD